MPVQDIEKDGSIAYKNAMVTNKSTPIDTHGVALFQSASDFDYQPGDRFWLLIGPERNSYEKDVPVINLRTMVAGSVPISHVSWFPKMRGPGNEVWTFGGRIRKQKLSGRNNFTFWSWGICQYLDGKPATTNAIQIPIRNVNTDKQQWLLSSEAWPLFSHIHKNMTKDRPQIFSPLLPPPQSSSWAGSSNILSRGLHTPPMSPFMDNLKPLDEDSSLTPTLIPKKLDMTAWKSIMDLASKGTLRPLQGSIIHPQRTPSSPDHRKYRRTDVDDTRSDSSCSENTARPSTRPPSRTMENGNIRPRSDDLRKLILAQDGGGIMGALCLTDMAREVAKQVANSRIQDSEQPVLSAAHSLFRTNPTILSTRHQIKKNMPTIEFLTPKRYHIAELCDLGKENCEWSLRFSSRHYHPDHRKYIIGKWIPKHEHCISSVRALPNIARPCLLIEGAHEHQCCV
ncbi:hypothetical protein EAF04_010547 [Stromatinia cepivora]|nr:hypothetical protein EAF04_010547 [Stromatinia cepivora]